VLSTKSAELNTCYDNAVKTEPAAAGKVTVLFTVEKKTGKISNVTADPARTTAPQSLVTCVVTAINGLVLNPGDQRDRQCNVRIRFRSARSSRGCTAAARAASGMTSV